MAGSYAICMTAFCTCIAVICLEIDVLQTKDNEALKSFPISAAVQQRQLQGDFKYNFLYLH